MLIAFWIVVGLWVLIECRAALTGEVKVKLELISIALLTLIIMYLGWIVVGPLFKL